MRRAKPQPIRNKIDLADPAQIRAWTRRLGVTADDLQRVAGKVGNSIAAVSKEINLRKTPVPKPSLPVQIRPASLPAVETVVTEVQLAATGGRKWIAIAGTIRDLGITPRCTVSGSSPLFWRGFSSRLGFTTGPTGSNGAELRRMASRPSAMLCLSPGAIASKSSLENSAGLSGFRSRP